MRRQVVIAIPVTVPCALMGMGIGPIDRITPRILRIKPGTLIPNLMRTTNLVWNRSSSKPGSVQVMGRSH